MASKTFVQLRADGSYDLRLEMSSVANTAGNYSDVTYNLYVRSIATTASYTFNSGNRVYLAINGTVILDTPSIGRVAFTGPNQTHQFAYGTIRVYHNTDGSKSAAVRAIFQQTQNLSLANYDINDTFVLDNVPRASTPTANVTSATLGATSITITTNRASSSFTHTLTMKIGNTTVKTATGVGASYTWTPEESLAKYFTTSSSATLSITCTTYNGSTNVGQKAGPSIVLNIPNTMVPSCSISVAEAATLPSGITGYIKTKSMLKITVTASGVQGSTISASTGYSITANGTTYKSATATTGALVKAGTNTITATVTDSRGKTKTESTTITVIDYNNPTISDISAYRCTSDTDSTALDTGEYICVDFTGVITSLSSQNTKLCYVKYKRSDETDYCEPIAIELSDYSFTNSYIFAASTDIGYNVVVTVEDSFKSNDFPATVSTGFTLINIPASGRGLGIGKVATIDGWVDNAWSENIDGQLAVGGVATLRKGSCVAGIGSGVSGTAGYIKFATFTIIGTYANQQIEMVITQRARRSPATLTFCFSNGNSTTGNITSFYISSATQYWVYASKSADNIVDLYIQKAENYDSVDVLSLHMGRYMQQRVQVEFKSELYDSVSNWTMPSYETIIPATPETGGQLRLIADPYGFFIRNDSASTYFMLTNSGDPYGTWNTLRPLEINNATGVVKTQTLNATTNIMHNGVSIVPQFAGSSWHGAMWFPNKKIMICWQTKSLTTTCNAAWGTGFETAAKCTFDNWYYAFNGVPTAIRQIHGSTNVGIMTQPYDPVTATSPGSIYGFRPESASDATSRTYRCTAIGIGTYT